jgi:hypothetical protein
MMYCSMREPSEVAKNFCSLTQAIEELTKLTPVTPSAVSLSFNKN